jgi:hypothetical protein
MADMQRKKEKINNQKRTLGNNLAERKKLLLDKVSSILSTGHYKTKEDIYKKVFNDDELQTLGYNPNKTINTVNSNNERKKESSKNVDNDKDNDGFFLTQGNNVINENKENNKIDES